MRASFFGSSLVLAAALFTFACDDDAGGDDEGSSSGSESPTSSSSSGSGSGSGSSSGGSTGGSSGSVPLSLHGEVQVLMRAKCTSCHSGDQPDALLDLNDISLMVNADSFSRPGERIVVPGDPDSSVLVQAVEGDPPGAITQMPRGKAPLGASDQAKIRQWVLDGAE